MATKMTFVFAALSCVVFATEASAQRHFSASDIQRNKALPKGRISISNDSMSIRATQTVGDIEKALFSLRTSSALHTRPSGSYVYQSNAALSAAIPAQLTGVITEAARAHSVDPRLIASVIRQESAFRPNAVSPVGALGLMQLMPATAKWLGVNNAMDVRQNVFGGTKYLRMLLDTFKGDLDLTLAAYNAGPGAVKKYRGIPPYSETRNYVSSIRRHYDLQMRGL